jgi:hypothetical protein
LWRNALIQRRETVSMRFFDGVTSPGGARTAIRPILWLVLALALPQPPAVADEAGEAGDWPLFRNQDTLQVRIEAPLSTLMRERSDTEYLEGTLAYTDASGQEHLLDLRLRARGKYRRQKTTCDLPPIRLNFKKTQVMGTEFAGQDKLKLVTHCQEGRDKYEQYVLKEYLAYRMLNAITDLSFRARLLRADYVDTDRDNAVDTRYAFVIEDDDLLAQRIEATALKVPSIRYSQLDAEQGALVTVFEYLIGNTDFSMVVGAKDGDCCHNVVLFAAESEGYIPIPYDFDFSGLVDATYAKPNPKLPIRRVTRRLYRGICEHNAHVGAAVSRFRENEDAIKQLVSSMDGLDETMRDRALEFIERFYDNTATAELVDRHLVRKCSS